MQKIISYVMGQAAKSNVEKRKVGCVIVDRTNKILAAGRNASFEDDCTPDIHAEDMAVQEFLDKDIDPARGPFTAYVSHPPCPVCAELLLDVGITKVEIVEEFMKFDSDKLRVDLIPTSMVRALGEALTYGASKYKPNNWRNNKDLSRFVAAMDRHILAYKEGTTLDESGLPHLWLAATNLAFIIELDKQSQKHIKRSKKRRG